MDAGAEALAFISISVKMMSFHVMSGQILSDKVYNQYQRVFRIFTDATPTVHSCDRILTTLTAFIIIFYHIQPTLLIFNDFASDI